jgi:hypothetical protein
MNEPEHATNQVHRHTMRERRSARPAIDHARDNGLDERVAAVSVLLDVVPVLF